MPKIILEKEDIEKLILSKYRGATIVGDSLKDVEVVIKMDEYVPQSPVSLPPIREPVRNTDGTIDAKASGLTLEPREKTNPGKAMGRERGRMPTF